MDQQTGDALRPDKTGSSDRTIVDSRCSPWCRWCRYFKAIYSFPILYYLAHVARLDPSNLHDLARVRCVLARCYTTSHKGRWGSRWSGWSVWSIWFVRTFGFVDCGCTRDCWSTGLCAHSAVTVPRCCDWFRWRLATCERRDRLQGACCWL